jgi:hypothetical protein
MSQQNRTLGDLLSGKYDLVTLQPKEQMRRNPQSTAQSKMAGNAVFATAFKDALKKRLKAGAMGEGIYPDGQKLNMSNMMVLDAIGEAEILLKDAGYDVDYNSAWDIAGQVIAKIPQP